MMPSGIIYILSKKFNKQANFLSNKKKNIKKCWISDIK